MRTLSDSTSRRSFIGGSDARIIMDDDETALLRLWREKRGEIEPEDLSNNLIVQLGTVTEHLNRHWYERNTGQVVDPPGSIPVHAWRSADGSPPTKSRDKFATDRVGWLWLSRSRPTFILRSCHNWHACCGCGRSTTGGVLVRGGSRGLNSIEAG